MKIDDRVLRLFLLCHPPLLRRDRRLSHQAVHLRLRDALRSLLQVLVLPLLQVCKLVPHSSGSVASGMAVLTHFVMSLL